MVKMTGSTKRVYDFIVQYALEHNTLPRQALIADRLFLSRTSVGYHIEKLVRDGYMAYNEEDQVYSVNGLIYRMEEDCG